MPDWTGWAEMCLEAVIIAASFIAVYEGARRLAADGFSRAAALMLALGVLAPAVEGSASVRLASGVQMLTRAMPSASAAEPAGGWEKAPMTPEERTARSTSAAEMEYLLSGRRGEVIDARGARVLFVPTQQDLHDRDELVRGQKGAEDAGQQFLERGVRLLATGTSVLLLGALAGFFQRRHRALSG